MENINSENKQLEEELARPPEKVEQSEGTGVKLKRPFLILLVAFAAAVVLDLLFFEKMWGWHWAVAVNLYLAAVVLIARLEGKKLPSASITLMVLTSLSALLTGFRSASATTTALVLFSGLGMLLVTVSLLNGQWMQFRLREWIGELFLADPLGRDWHTPINPGRLPAFAGQQRAKPR